MEGLLVILLYAFKLAFPASLACIRTKEFLLKSEVKKAYLHAHKRMLIMPAIMKEVYWDVWSRVNFILIASNGEGTLALSNTSRFEICVITS